MTPTFKGEVQFRRYSDTSTQGQQIVLAVADREALQPFIGLEGKRFMAVFVQIGDDEMPVEPQKPPTKVGPLCREAVDLCKSAGFQKWTSTKNEHEAALWVRSMCQVESRKELDTIPYAGHLFRTEIRNPFMRWQR